MPPRTLLVLNPAAGQGDPDRLLRQLAGAFAVRGEAFDVAKTAGPGDAEEAARLAAAEGYRAVVAIGGDGTLGEVLTGTAGTGLPVGVIPRGTGNQVACNLGIPRALEAAVEVAVRGTPVPIDLGQMDDGRYFALAAGAGWDAAMIALATRQMKDRWGFGAYVYAGMRVGVAKPTSLFRITADGVTVEAQAAMVLVANMGQFGARLIAPNGLLVGPAVSPRDGLLDVCIFAPRGRRDLPALLWRIARGRYSGDERLVYLQGADVTVESDPPAITEVDGELSGPTPLRARVVPGGATILVPRSAA
ncbi:MAG TPA: diacylglycerol kinase family protein [Longimicrobium sp.]|nr:diacylglycerol kinase family protein [Longimicrobium sp.]